MKKVVSLFIFCAVFFANLSQAGPGGPFDFSTGFSFNRTKYSADSYSWTRTYGASLGIDLTSMTQIEFAYQNTTTRNKINNYEDTTFTDRVYSTDIIQMILSRNSPIQPYVKAGIGQMNRDASGTYANGVSPGATTDSITAVIGGGLRIYLTRFFGIRTEVTSYLTGARISTYKDNIAYTLGATFSF